MSQLQVWMTPHPFFPQNHPHEYVQCNASTNATTVSLGLPNCDRTPESHRVFLECHRWPQDLLANQAVTTPEHGPPHMPKSIPIARATPTLPLNATQDVLSWL